VTVYFCGWVTCFVAGFAFLLSRYEEKFSESPEFMAVLGSALIAVVLAFIWPAILGLWIAGLTQEIAKLRKREPKKTSAKGAA
jgi:ABC-type sugar transport system permease subunit